MPRRTHRKSRLGCSECKRRHVKCDETHPTCVNCATAHIRCPFENLSPSSQNSASRTISHHATPSPATLGDSNETGNFNSSRRPLDRDSDHDESSQDLNMVHIELILQWTSETYRSFALNGEQAEIYHRTCTKYGLRFPFLMQELLAISALHISVLRSEKSSFYRLQSTQLQSQALAGFNKIISEIDASSVVPAFLFASMIGMHSFCETFVYRQPNFNEVLYSFTSCINLLRGVRSVIGGWWDTLQKSELAPILLTAHDLHTAGTKDSEYLIPLRDMIETADIGTSSASAYSKAIDQLAILYNVQTQLSEEEKRHTANMIFSWPVTVEQDYLDLMTQRRPEALIILAFYAALLHSRGEFWAIGDSGEYLIRSIGSHLGRHWDKWLSWPNALISGSVVEIF